MYNYLFVIKSKPPLKSTLSDYGGWFFQIHAFSMCIYSVEFFLTSDNEQSWYMLDIFKNMEKDVHAIIEN